MSNTSGLNFQQDRIIFGGVRVHKYPKMVQFMDAASPQKQLKIYKLTTTNAIKIKRATIVYLHDTFHLKKKLGRQL